MGLGTWALRRVMGRLRITDDIVRHLTTFQRLGETVEVQLPGELLPVGARTAFRAVRTRAATQLGPDWVWPYWLEKQLDPTSPSFIPRGHLPSLTNVTARNWTMVGNVGSRLEGIVDPAGLVTPWFDGWSLDWWIGAEDRWHFPSRSATIRQRLVEETPVVETAMRVPGGDAIQRVYAVPDPGAQGEEGPGELIVIEIENASPVPFAVALAARPYNPEGLAVVERIDFVDDVVTIDGRPALLFPRRPSAMAASTFHDGDCVATVTSGGAGPDFPKGLRCPAGLAQAAFLFPLAHTAVLRVAIPLDHPRRTRRRSTARRRAGRVPALPPALPAAAAVAKGWQAQSRRGLRLELPDSKLARAVDANRRFMLLFHDGDEITPGPMTYHRFWFRDAAYQLAALDRFGFHRESAEVLRSYPARQHHDGFFFSQRQEWDANGAALWSIAEHWRLTRDDHLLAELGTAITNGVEWIEHKRKRGRRRAGEGLDGLLPAGISAEHLGPFDFFYWDDFWAWRGLVDGVDLLEALGESAAAAEARTWRDSMAADIRRSLATVAARLGTAAIPAGPRRRIDAGVIGSLVACSPLGLIAADDPAMAATVELVRERFCQGPAFYQAISHTGLGTYLTLQLAAVELEAGDRRALDRLQWFLDAATPTWTWPEAIHPALGGGCMGDGHHGWAAADLLSFARNLLVREVPGGLALCSQLPAGWEGQGIEVHDAPTHHGLLSFAVRWHGERPAVLWELRPHDREASVTFTAPGLDATWSSTDRGGEALLAPYHELERA